MVNKLTETDGVAEQYIVELAISKQELLKYYRGAASQISAVATDGQTILFPVTAIQPFVTHEGVFGRFQLQVNSQGRLLKISLQ
ncbi:MAG: hypothetical protein CBD32_02885 [Actinobacteria bacterium TMED172]|jgi:hypothetical protein|nr:hypothetical protein [Cellvibrionales bacterium]OUW33413.1 MAG: hypothetical protein CBD32_02885 [Actinobacteria bacterium TMED172]|tara:strand:- start:1717 stop:1968 length:252 start_codon:yes stop_codon:yes gene_type:complete